MLCVEFLGSPKGIVLRHCEVATPIRQPIQKLACDREVMANCQIDLYFCMARDWKWLSPRFFVTECRRADVDAGHKHMYT